MKKNLFKLLFSALFVLGVSPAFSQFSVGGDLAFPSGDWSNGWSTGLGLSGRYEAAIQPKLNWTASLGFLTFSGKTVIGSKLPSETVIPLTGGIKYYFQKSNSGVYGAADAGLFFLNNNQGTKFGISPGIGYRIEQVDFSLRYNVVTDFSYWGLRVAYIIPGT